MTGRIMALDVGDRRIGVAASDILGITAQGIETYTRCGNLNEDVLYITRLARELSAVRIVFGLPKNMDGSLGFQAQSVKAFADALASEYSGDIDFFDERLSSVSAHEALRSGGLKTKKHKAVVDKIAAVIILQTYLEKHGGSL